MLGGILNNNQHHCQKYLFKKKKIKLEVLEISHENQLLIMLITLDFSPSASYSSIAKESPRCNFFVKMLSYLIIQSLFDRDSSSRL